MVTYRGHRYAISAPAPCTSRFGGHRGSWRRSNGECSCDGQQGHPAHDRVGGWRDPVLLAGVDRDERLCDARGYLQAFSSGGGALLEGVGRRADAALDRFHPSWARDPRQQRDATSRPAYNALEHNVTCPQTKPFETADVLAFLPYLAKHGLTRANGALPLPLLPLRRKLAAWQEPSTRSWSKPRNPILDGASRSPMALSPGSILWSSQPARSHGRFVTATTASPPS